MGHERSSSGALINRRSRRQKRYCLDPGERHAVDGVFDEAKTNGFSIGSWLRPRSAEFKINEIGRSNGAMDSSSADESKASAPRRSLDVDNHFRARENSDERSDSKDCLVDLVSNGEESIGSMIKICGQPKSTPDIPLRRSARKANSITLNCNENGEKHFKHSEPGADDFKFALPPSSSDLDVDGLPVDVLFSVYSFLRSFSRSLFLSPFSLETFVAALRCKYANSLIDFIHFSLLHALKPHWKFLMEEKLKPSNNCNRILNWDFLDIVTWPYFLVEYILFCDFAMRFDFKLAHCKLLDVEYYQQPAELKLKILRCLCDNAIEVESLRAEINRRVTDSEVTIDLNNNMNSSRKQNYSVMYGERVLVEEKIDEIADGNSDECCLCRMDGNLICCDGCPAAFHSKCVGVVKSLLPEGEWYCPECMVDNYGVISFMMSFKGADFLGRDSHGRLYSSCCGYLLV